MQKYHEEYFSVLDKKTGRKIVDCGEELDALAMVAFDTQNRTYTCNKFLMGPVVDIQIPKALPTTNLTVTNVKKDNYTIRKQLQDAGQLKLKEDERMPLKLDNK